MSASLFVDRNLRVTADWIANAAKSRKLVFFAGAGVSVRAPSVLPNASQLMHNAVQCFCADYETYLKELKLRPEVMFRFIERHRGLLLYDFLQAQFAHRAFNQNHSLMATALLSKNVVITSNFDLLIEKACLHIGARFAAVVRDGAPPAGVPILFKIHGSIDDQESLRVTINHAHRGLSSTSSSLLRSVTEDKHLVVLGYSGRDELDIMPALTRCNCRSVIWIIHDEGRAIPVEESPPNRYVRALRNLTCVRVDTSLLVDQVLLASNPAALITDQECLEQMRLPVLFENSSALRIAIDILMHQNEYEKVLELITRQNGIEDLYLKAAFVRVLHMIRPGDPAISDERFSMVDSIEALEDRDVDLFYPALAQYARPGEQLYRVAARLRRRLTAEDTVSEAVLEACLEISFRLINVGDFDEAEFFINAALTNAQQQSDLLLEARAHILWCALIDERQSVSPNKSKALLTKAIEHADRAIFLLEEDIFNDPYYQYQAKNNKAEALVMLGDSEAAIPLFEESARYYEHVHQRSYAQILSNLAGLHFENGRYETALTVINEALKAMDEELGGRSLATAYRRKASILKAVSTGAAMKSDGIKLLEKALELLERGGNTPEAEETRRELNEF
jgi:hypothetical protein